jgi:hypothetical protein
MRIRKEGDDDRGRDDTRESELRRPGGVEVVWV